MKPLFKLGMARGQAPIALVALLVTVVLTFLPQVQAQSPSSTGPARTITDGEFAAWTPFHFVTDDPFIAGPPPNLSTGRVERVSTGGNPGAYLKFTHTIASGDTSWVGAIKSDISYDPRVQGAILNLSLSADVNIKPSGGAWQLVVEQAGQRYYTVPWRSVGAGLQTVAAKNLTALDFDTNPWAESSGSGVARDGKRPDFSATAPPLRFGFMFGHRVVGGGTRSCTCALDNFAVSISSAAQALVQPATQPAAGASRQANQPTAGSNFLQEMPSPDRVLAEIRGSNDLDTAARQVGAFYQLKMMITDLVGFQPPPEAIQLHQTYFAAMGRVQQTYFTAMGRVEIPKLDANDKTLTETGSRQAQLKWSGLMMHYETDRSLRDELLKRFFSPAWQRNYLAIQAAQNDRRVAGKAAQAQRNPMGSSLAHASSILNGNGLVFLALLVPFLIGILIIPLSLRVKYYFKCRQQRKDKKEVETFKQYRKNYIKDHKGRIVLAVAACLMCGPVGPIIALLVMSANNSEFKEYRRQFEQFKKQIVTERRQWVESLGATHEARVKTVNEMFDRKDKTVTFSVAYEFKRSRSEAPQGAGREDLEQFLYFRISRNLAAMAPREREMLRVVELLNSFNEGKREGWYEWAKVGLVWGDGKASIGNYSAWIHDQDKKGIKQDDFSSWIKWFMEKSNNSVEKVVNNVLDSLEKRALEKDQNPELAKLLATINGRLKGGSAWLSADDVSKTPFAPQNNFALRIGLLDDTGQELTYSGEGSLISIAPPGSGKTQCNVFPNLLTWRGPTVVLDVKGEIYAKTSKWRAENVGPVFKFSPLDPARSHSYNPLSFIRQETDYIWEDSRFLADMMIVPSGGTDPFWENKARDVLTAAIAHVCYSNTPDQRPMSRITDIIHGGKAWEEMVLGLQTAVDVRSMMQQGTSLAEMNEKTRDSVLQTAQSSLSAWSGERISRVTQKSDWSPLDLRSGRNPTIYICLKPSEVDSYISLLRVFIAQHIRMLTSELPPHGVAPILFLLDELPRLKQMPPVEEAIEIGRQYGLRLWMFAQSLGQLEQAYPNAEGIVGSCAVRIFMNPSSHDGTAEKLSEELGFRESALDGARLKVVEAADLAGPDYKDYQIVMAASCKPVKVKKAFAWQDAELTKRMGSL